MLASLSKLNVQNSTLAVAAANAADWQGPGAPAAARRELTWHRVLWALVFPRKRHRIALYGRGNEDADRMIADLRRIVTEEAAIFGQLPYREYLFIIHLSDKPGGGLEHRGSNTSAPASVM